MIDQDTSTTDSEVGPMQDWRVLDTRHVWHPYTQMLTAPAPVPIVRARGAYLYTTDGRRIIDAISSWWVTLHGHAHPHVSEAIARQAATLEQVIFAGFAHEPASRLAAALAGLLPGDLDRVFYSDNGSTAVEVALKMCVQYWRHHGQSRSRFIALEGAYHGDTFGAMAVSARSVFTASFDEMLFDVARLPFPADTASTEAFLAHAERELRTGAVAGVIVEPIVLGAGGMRMWTAEALAQLQSLCAIHRTPLIADEVMTGFGRTGRMFAIEHAAITPDIVCLSKGITGGFLPLGATVCRDHIYDVFLSSDPERTFFHGHSYTANPIACAAALASLDVFSNESTLERIAEIERVHQTRLSAIAGRPRVKQARCAGSIAAFDVVSDQPGYLDPVGKLLGARALEAGILLRPLGNTVYLLPPYAITDDDLHHVYDFLESATDVH